MLASKGSLLAGALIVTLGMAWPGAARAVDGATRTMLRELSRDGVEAYHEGKYDVAVEKLEKAYAILPSAPLGLWSARALEKTGKLVEASERYVAASRAALDPGGEREPQEEAKAEARKEQAALEPRIPRLTVRVTGTDGSELDLVVNDQPIESAFLGQPMPVNPGTVVVTLRQGDHEVQRSLTLAEGERSGIDIDWRAEAGQEPPKTEPPESTPTHEPGEGRREAGPRRSWQPLAGWIGIGVGAGGLVLGGVTGAMAADLHRSLGCDGTGCPASTTPEQRTEGNTLRTLSTVGFVAGGVLAATGLTLLLTAPKRRETAAVIVPVIGFGSLGVEGTF